MLLSASCRGDGPLDEDPVPAAACGNGALDPPEQCDDGPANGQYGHCAATCLYQLVCGNGVVEVGDEVCDDGIDNGAYGYCTADCSRLGPRCGDGRTDVAYGEVCDDGGLNGVYDYCASDCRGRAPTCGDGIIDTAEGESCDDGERNGDYGSCSTACLWPAFPPPAGPVSPPASWLSSPPPCAADDWLAKYFNYRVRFRGNGTAAHPGFISIGPGPGQSIPASFRDSITNCSSDWWLSHKGCPQPEGSGKYSWGDATIWLGEYLALLATEYAVFSELAVDPAETLEDLYYALMAFNRVDEAAEGSPYNVAPMRNGFFLRDDVPPGFERRADGTFRFPRDEPDSEGFGCVEATSACGPPSVDDGSYTSQDQVMGMVYGLAHVVALLPDGMLVQGTDLRLEARAQVHRLVMHLRSNGWRVTDPNGDHPPDAWGGNAISFSNRLAIAANTLCGNRYGVADYRDDLSQSTGELAFSGLLAIWELTHSYNRTMAFRIMTATNEWSASEMAERTRKDAKELFAFSHAVVNGHAVDDEISLWRIESLLTSAPCGGPCNGTPGCVYAEGWGGESRWTSPASRIISQHHPRKEFNGIDYMLMHNLYFLAKKGAYALIVPEPPDSGCDEHRGLEAILGSGVLGNETYDPGAPCNARDLRRSFCGRSFAAWLDDAYRGRATIAAGGARWLCEGQNACRLVTGVGLATAGVDLILGSSDNDTLSGLDGDDCIYGFGGDDLLYGGNGQDEIHGGIGADQIFGESELALVGDADVLWGDEDDDVIAGGPGGDEVYGGSGHDQLLGEAGDDLMIGHDGDDLLDGGAGNNRIRGGPGDDTIIGSSGDDLLYGEEGRDKLDGQGGADWLYGDAGDDLLRGGDGDDRLFGSVTMEESDRLCGGAGDDEIWGNWSGGVTCLSGPGEDEVVGCADGSASELDCGDAAFAAW